MLCLDMTHFPLLAFICFVGCSMVKKRKRADVFGMHRNGMYKDAFLLIMVAQ
jgi:hypothetical protein